MHRDRISIERVAPAAAALPTGGEYVPNAHFLEARLRAKLNPLRFAETNAGLRRAACPFLDDCRAGMAAKKTARVRYLGAMGHDEGVGSFDAGQRQRHFR